jgi:outer membrane protein OmpA-like peptidoglycan-associated protein
MKQKHIFVLLILTAVFTKLIAYNKTETLNPEKDLIVINPGPAKDSVKNSFTYKKGENLVLNGDFEQGNLYFYSSLNYSSQEVMPGNYSVTKNSLKHNLAFASVPDHTSGSGNFLLIDASPQEDSKNWCSKIKIDPNSEYVFSFFASNINLHFTKPANLILSINGKQIGDEINLPDDSHEWIEYKWQWFSENINDSIDVGIKDVDAVADGNDFGIDDIRFYKITKEIPIPKENCLSTGDTLPYTVHFPFNESSITQFSKAKLEQLLIMLHKCPKMKIKIIGHTDIFGTDTYNNNLSARRAKSIFDFLESNGISENRMSMEAMGESQILFQSKSIKDNVKNRRVHFVVSGYRQ